jgi:hypothetical protein
MDGLKAESDGGVAGGIKLVADDAVHSSTLVVVNGGRQHRQVSRYRPQSAAQSVPDSPANETANPRLAHVRRGLAFLPTLLCGDGLSILQRFFAGLSGCNVWLFLPQVEESIARRFEAPPRECTPSQVEGHAQQYRNLSRHLRPFVPLLRRDKVPEGAFNHHAGCVRMGRVGIRQV